MYPLKQPLLIYTSVDYDYYYFYDFEQKKKLIFRFYSAYMKVKPLNLRLKMITAFPVFPDVKHHQIHNGEEKDFISRKEAFTRNLI